ncbi:S-locus-specific glycoprotein S13-like [Prosopis cineraria]|uniref:S-locus-specific glycoprotein S13-like n=1 Tax=Prosopis cineraria TaxID=364024 RepID=UPI00240EDC61|nr:S-locus-specific glycoprotein S13-like [Prosopis cineraria]
MVRTLALQDSITPRNFIRDGETLASASGFFELGFFSLGSPNIIWCKKSPSTAFWVANRDAPINNDSGKGISRLNDHGVLLLLDATDNAVWSSNYSSSRAYNPFAQLLDSGNIVVKNGRGSGSNGNLDQLSWQSFDHPCDTLMPGMKLGWSQQRGLDKFLSSWKSSDDPGGGDYIIKIDGKGYPQAIVLKGSEAKVRAGSWNGFYCTGFPSHNVDPLPTDEFVSNEIEVSYKYELTNNSIFHRYTVTPSGICQRFGWAIKQAAGR